MNIISYVMLVSVLGLCGSINPMEKALKKSKQAMRVVLKDNQETSITMEQYNELKKLCSESINLALEGDADTIGGDADTISLPGLSIGAFDMLIKYLTVLTGTDIIFENFFEDLLVRKQFEDYKMLVVAADYLDIEAMSKAAFTFFEKCLHSMIQHDRALLLEFFSLPFGYGFSKEGPGLAALLFAIKEGDLEVAEGLISFGVDCNSFLKLDGPEITPLTCAAMAGHTDIIEMLLNRGAQLEYEVDGCTALVMAAFMGSKKGIKALLKHGARIAYISTGNEEMNAVVAACERGSAEIAELLIVYDIQKNWTTQSVQAQEASGIGEIVKAAPSKFVPIVLRRAAMKLFAKGTMPAVDRPGFCFNESNIRVLPLSYTLDQDKIELAKLLLAYGAEVNPEVLNYCDDATPLMDAVIAEDPDMAELLLLCGARVDTVRDFLDGDGPETALDLATNAGMIAVLKKYGAEKFEVTKKE